MTSNEQKRKDSVCVGGGLWREEAMKFSEIHSMVWEHPYQEMKSQSILMVGRKEYKERNFNLGPK